MLRRKPTSSKTGGLSPQKNQPQRLPDRSGTAPPIEKAFRNARESLIYRFSESVFASLLAAYIITFVSLAAPEFYSHPASFTQPHYNEGTVPLSLGDIAIFDKQWGKLIDLASVCLAYTFLTTAMFLKYNMAILTLPTYDLRLASRDFSFAVFQAAAFSISVIWPFLLPLTLSLIIFLSLAILRYEINNLIEWLKDFCTDPDFLIIKSERLRRRHRILLSQQLFIKIKIAEHGFSDWHAPGRLHIILTGILAISDVVLLLAWWYNWIASQKMVTMIPIVNASVAIGILINSFFLFRRSGEFYELMRNQSDTQQRPCKPREYEKLTDIERVERCSFDFRLEMLKASLKKYKYE